jgi:hypothetical protein
MKERKGNFNLQPKVPQHEKNRRKFSIYSLIRFYQENSKNYEKSLKDNPHESDVFYRKLYTEKAMCSLEIESLITIRLTRKQRRTELANRDYQIKEMKQTIARDSEYISSILTLLYNNEGDMETGENIEIGDRLIELWKETFEKQNDYVMFAWKNIDKFKILPMADIVQELTRTIMRIKKPYDELEQRVGQKLSTVANEIRLNS